MGKLGQPKCRTRISQSHNHIATCCCYRRVLVCTNVDTSVHECSVDAFERIVGVACVKNTDKSRSQEYKGSFV